MFFNASCGMRLRLLSAYGVFKELNWPTFILELESNEICWMSDTEGFTKLTHKGNISINEWLAIFGAELEDREDQYNFNYGSQVTQLAGKWAHKASDLTQALSVLNFLATSSRKSGSLSVTLTDRQLGYIELREVFSDLISQGLIKVNGYNLIFNDEHAREFCNGQWLTNYVYYTLLELKQEFKHINDVVRNITFNRRIGNMKIKNKFDVACMVNNKLFIIECKTKSMKDTGDNTLYKLDSLKEFIGGLQSKSVLISLKPLRTSDIFRSTDLDIFVIGPSELPNFKNIFKEWLTLHCMD